MFGKTTFAFNLLRNIDTLFRDPRCAQNVIFYYNVWQSSYDKAMKEKLVKEWIHKLPTTDEFNVLPVDGYNIVYRRTWNIFKRKITITTERNKNEEK